MRDNVQILGSPLGMYSMLRENFVISVVRDDGSLDEEKCDTLIAGIANMGANGLRDFTWIDSESAYDNISPFWPGHRGTFKFNETYFQDQRKIALTCNRYGLRYYFCLFDECGTKSDDVSQWNPWRFFDDYFYDEDAKELRHKYIDRLLDALHNLDYGFDICNEPKAGQAEFLADTFIYLKRNGFNPDNIILGNDYGLKEKHNNHSRDYREFRNRVVAAFGLDWAKHLKTKCISPVHNANDENIKELWGDNVRAGGDRRILYSMDGVRRFSFEGESVNHRPNKDYVQFIAEKVLNTKLVAREQGKVHFEVVYGKRDDQPLDSILGISEAYKKIWGNYPANFGQHTVRINPNVAIVTRGYRAILGRAPDPNGLKFYVELLDNGGTILKFCQKLTTGGDEFTNRKARISAEDLAHDLYNGALDRDPDPGGLEVTIKAIKNNRTAHRTAAMLTSREYKNKFC
ncbi:MAG: DUF4214 domain-containing protein [bacterium]|nr:DUF4214 domain-containing protein [bacterium]